MPKCHPYPPNKDDTKHIWYKNFCCWKKLPCWAEKKRSMNYYKKNFKLRVNKLRVNKYNSWVNRVQVYHNTILKIGNRIKSLYKVFKIKMWITLGWKAIAVTKSMCWKQQRHSFREMCQSRTVLSIDEERTK